MKRHAFTLVELMVVIAVISVLASMLLPSLKNAMESGYIIRCLNNQRQIGIALQDYSSDYRGWGPPTKQWYGNNGLWPYVYDNAPDGNALKHSRTIFNCPRESERPGWAVGRIYAVNIMLPPTQGWGPEPDNLLRIKNPSRAVYLIESYDSNNGYWTYTRGTASNITLHHRGGINCLFVDSHAMWMSGDAVPLNASADSTFWKGD
jgi:prepilin-type N-terminal cleavage/methylation domain-containing protein/prepilin-type processing-associated H-X9-DG protein